jgi:hypothetical protein
VSTPSNIKRTASKEVQFKRDLISETPETRRTPAPEESPQHVRKVIKRINSTKHNNRLSTYDEDYLGKSHPDILKDVLTGKKNNNTGNNQFLKTDVDKNTSNKLNSEEDDQDFRKLIMKETKQGTRSMDNLQPRDNNMNDKTNVINDQVNLFTGASPNSNEKGEKQEDDIKFKESFLFRINSSNYKFTFTHSDTLGKGLLTFYNYDDEGSPKNVINLDDLRDYLVVSNNEGKWKGLLQLNYKDSNKPSLEISAFDKSDFEKFIWKLNRYVKKAA